MQPEGTEEGVAREPLRVWSTVLELEKNVEKNSPFFTLLVGQQMKLHFYSETKDLKKKINFF